MPKPIKEGDFNQGVSRLLDKGLIPKDVDLTVAFETGAAPVTIKGAVFHDKSEMNVRREFATGGIANNHIKFDLQPPRILAPIKPKTEKQTKTLIGQMKSIQGLQVTQLALNVPNETIKLALPEPSQTSPQAEVPDARGYNELMDVYSLHQLMIRRGTILEQTPEFVSFKRTYMHKWGSISYVLHLLERMMTEAEVDLCYVEGRKVAMYSLRSRFLPTCSRACRVRFLQPQ
jgi:hypothetical protein